MAGVPRRRGQGELETLVRRCHVVGCVGFWRCVGTWWSPVRGLSQVVVGWPVTPVICSQMVKRRVISVR
jgi:hypothetical protein